MSRSEDSLAVRSILLLIVVFIMPFARARAAQADHRSPDSASGVLPAWTEGTLYIHHISTGRGNAAYVVMPDGTTMLIDAGEADPSFIASVAPLKRFPDRPDAVHS